MYQKRAFNRAEQDPSRKLRTETELLVKRINEIDPLPERVYFSAGWRKSLKPLKRDAPTS